MTPCPTETAKWHYLNGEMEPEAAEAFALHLGVCPACRAEMEGLRMTASELRSLPKPEASAALAAAAKAALARTAGPVPAERFRYSRWFSLAAGGALFLAVLILAAVFPVSVPTESITSFFRLPADPPISDAARDLIGKVVAFLPLLLVPSILENLRFLFRRKHKNPPPRVRLFSI